MTAEKLKIPSQRKNIVIYKRNKHNNSLINSVNSYRLRKFIDEMKIYIKIVIMHRTNTKLQANKVISKPLIHILSVIDRQELRLFIDGIMDMSLPLN